MDMLGLVMALSAILWYIIDRIKPLWSEKEYGKYITMIVAGIASLGIILTYGIDIIFALGFSVNVTTIGQVLTALLMMSGSSAIAELIEKFKGGK